MDTVSEGRLKEVNPVLADKVRQAAELLAAQGITIRVTQGLRSWEMQQEIYQQGRDINGKVINPSKVVSDAPPGYSWHEFGLAVDVCPFDDNGEPIGDTKNPDWKAIVEIAPQVGLLSGSCFSDPDRPHLQYTGQYPETPNNAVRVAYREGGLPGLWQSISA